MRTRSLLILLLFQFGLFAKSEPARSEGYWESSDVNKFSVKWGEKPLVLFEHNQVEKNQALSILRRCQVFKKYLVLSENKMTPEDQIWIYARHISGPGTVKECSNPGEPVADDKVMGGRRFDGLQSHFAFFSNIHSIYVYNLQSKKMLGPIDTHNGTLKLAGLKLIDKEANVPPSELKKLAGLPKCPLGTAEQKKSTGGRWKQEFVGHMTVDLVSFMKIYDSKTVRCEWRYYE